MLFRSYTLDTTVGEERIFVVLAQERLTELEGTLASGKPVSISTEERGPRRRVRGVQDTQGHISTEHAPEDYARSAPGDSIVIVQHLFLHL